MAGRNGVTVANVVARLPWGRIHFVVIDAVADASGARVADPGQGTASPLGNGSARVISGTCSNSAYPRLGACATCSRRRHRQARSGRAACGTESSADGKACAAEFTECGTMATAVSTSGSQAIASGAIAHNAALRPRPAHGSRDGAVDALTARTPALRCCNRGRVGCDKPAPTQDANGGDGRAPTPRAAARSARRSPRRTGTRALIGSPSTLPAPPPWPSR